MGAKRKPLSPAERRYWKAVAARLIDLRGPKTKAALAREVGVTVRAYDAWEHGESRITDANQRRLAKAHRVSQNYILYGQDKPVRRSELERIETKLETLTRAVEEASSQALRGDPVQGLENLLRELRDEPPSGSEGEGDSGAGGS